MRLKLLLALFLGAVWLSQSAFIIRAGLGTPNGGSVTLTDVTIAGLHSVTFTAPASANTSLGTAVVSTTGGPFTGTLAPSGTDAARFHFVGSDFQTQASGPLCGSPPCTYSFNIVATQDGAAGSPFTQAFTGSGSLPGTANPVGWSVLTNTTLNTPTVNNANTVIGDIRWPGSGASASFTGQVLLSAASPYLTLTDAAAGCSLTTESLSSSVLLTCTNATARPLAKLRVGSSNIAAGRYDFDLIHVQGTNRLAIPGVGTADGAAAGCGAPGNHVFTVETNSSGGQYWVDKDGVRQFPGMLALIFDSIGGAPIQSMGATCQWTAKLIDIGDIHFDNYNRWFVFPNTGSNEAMSRPAYYQQQITISVGTLAADGTQISANDGNTLVTGLGGNLSWKGSNYYGGILTSGASITSLGNEANWVNVAQKAGVFNGGVPHIKYNTMLPSPAPAQRCQAAIGNGQGITNQIYAGDGQTITDLSSNVWSFNATPTTTNGAFYGVLKNGSSVSQAASLLQLAADGTIYAKDIYYGEWSWNGSSFVQLHNVPPGFFREVTCPGGF